MEPADSRHSTVFSKTDLITAIIVTMIIIVLNTVLLMILF